MTTEDKMRQWKYLNLSISINGVSVYCTDTEVLNSVVAIAKNVVPSCQTKVVEKLPTGEAFSIFVNQLQDQDFPVGHLILKQLCLNGWELIAANEKTSVYKGTEGFIGQEYHFKFEVA